MRAWVLPEYGSRSIVEIPHFITEYFGAERHPLLKNHSDSKTLDFLGIKPEKEYLVLFIIDGLGYQLYKKLKDDNVIPFLASLKDAYLTSTFPSTTATALVSLSTGLVPAKHGILGFKMFLERPYTTMNTIFYTIHGLETTKVPQEPQEFMADYYIYEALARSGVRVYSILKKEFIGSPFSKIVHGYIENSPHVHEIDLLTQVPRILQKAAMRTFISLYTSTLDSLSHTYGPYSEEVFEFMRVLDGLLERLIGPILDRIQILVTADHGHIDTSGGNAINICNSASIYRKIIGFPAGEPRAVYLRVKHKKEFLREIKEEYGDLVSVMEVEDAEKEGLWGGKLENDYRDRVGDIVLIPKEDAYILCKDEAQEVLKMKGRHGGLSIEEMLVPLIFN